MIASAPSAQPVTQLPQPLQRSSFTVMSLRMAFMVVSLSLCGRGAGRSSFPAPVEHGPEWSLIN